MTVTRADAHRGTVFDVVNPATGEVFAQAPQHSPADLDAAVARACTAWPAWRADAAGRRAAMIEAAAAVEHSGPELATLLTREQGKPLAESRAEIARVATRLRHFSGLTPRTELLRDGRAMRSELRWRSLGPVAAITPWNFPLQLASAKIAPAFAAGSTVVLKPSPYTPLATALLESVLGAVLPPGVFGVVTGREPLGSLLAGHPDIAHVTFTGSIATGRKVAVQAARGLKRVTLELGGNDAAIILDDADVAQIADALFWSAFRNCGQVCMAVKRVYAPDRLYDDVVAALAFRARRAIVGDGLAEATRIGPVNNVPQLERVELLVAASRAAGARVAAGGHRPDRPGYFFAPTILADVPGDAAVVTEEQFGPVLPVIRYSNLDTAVRAANATRFGLGGSVWGTDLDRAAAVADRLECGTVWINHHAELSLAQPFTGMKDSGVGVAGGEWGMYGNLRPMVVHRPESADG
ncbi:aldehyde dehydrogenase family protein [Nocardia sp. alder85J]|uniref:aldehyde dehydrogenase family protein n=1 Tax=Nocardia sp. alder85J TaxID=2862949 RepID=UPI001CD49AAC|nr:aldehyde dehydrogenase family protein [Nocardia sp. alder85J]MCX4094657.1 aldehyde dehydrogenase family protein [Nocardia sp. alder85J]